MDLPNPPVTRLLAHYSKPAPLASPCPFPEPPGLPAMGSARGTLGPHMHPGSKAVLSNIQLPATCQINCNPFRVKQIGFLVVLVTCSARLLWLLAAVPDRAVSLFFQKVLLGSTKVLSAKWFLPEASMAPFSLPFCPLLSFSYT